MELNFQLNTQLSQAQSSSVKIMLKTSIFSQPWLTSLLSPLTLGVTWLTLGIIPVAANPLIIQAPSCSTVIYGSPIPSPVPMNTVTGQPCAFSGYDYPNYNSSYNYGYNHPVRTTIRGTIRHSTIINPTIIDSTISDSVLVDPVIINSPPSSRRVILHSDVIYPSSEIRIWIRE